MDLRLATQILTVAFLFPMALATTACNSKDSGTVRGGNLRDSNPQNPIQPHEAELKLLEKTFTEADSMFDQVWAKLSDKTEVINISSPFTLVQEAIKDTLLRIEREEVIDCRQHEEGTVFLDIAGAPQMRVISKITCVNREPFRQEIVRLVKASGFLYKWQFKTDLMENELGDVFVRRAKRGQHILCEVAVAPKDGIIEKMKCEQMGRTFGKKTSEYIHFNKYEYNRSGRRLLSVDARLINAATNKETKKKLELPIQGAATLTVTLPESDEAEVVAPPVETPKRLVPEQAPVAPAAKPATPIAPMLSAEEQANEDAMDKVIAEHCTEADLEFLKKQVSTKAEIADSCASGEIVQEEIKVDQLPSTR